MTRRRMVGASVVVLVGGCMAMHVGTPRAERSTSEVSVARRSLRRNVAGWGRIEGASEEIRIGSKMPGIVREMPVAEGERVAAGQLLVVLDHEEHRARVDAARAEVERAEARLRLLEAGARPEERERADSGVLEAAAVADAARAQLARFQELRRLGLVSTSDFDQSARDARTAAARLAASRQMAAQVRGPARAEELDIARSEIRLASARLVEAEVLLDATQLRSPVDGLVVRHYLHAGESIRVDQVGNPIISVIDDSRCRARAQIDDSEVARIAVGQPATVTSDAYRNTVFRGTVRSLAGAVRKKSLFSDDPTETHDREVLEAVIELDPGDKRCPIVGLRVDVAVLAVERDGVLVVPQTAVYRRAAADFVLVKAGDRWVEHGVRIGETDGFELEVLEGVAEGDVVMSNAREGAKS